MNSQLNIPQAETGSRDIRFGILRDTCGLMMKLILSVMACQDLAIMGQETDNELNSNRPLKFLTMQSELRKIKKL